MRSIPVNYLTLHKCRLFKHCTLNKLIICLDNGESLTYIVSALADLEDAGPVAERLLRNQDDIGNAIKPYYGDDAGRKLAALLRDHILIAAGIVKADLVQI
jgi:hypothetical protein